MIVNAAPRKLFTCKIKMLVAKIGMLVQPANWITASCQCG
jgi:hypothetical protein